MALHRDRDEELENLLNRGGLWAVTYGDLMSFLMIFFLILFVLTLRGKVGMAKGLSDLQAQFGGQDSSPAIERLKDRGREETAAEQMKNNLFARGLQEFVTVDVTERRINVTLRDPILFDSGDAVLKAGARPLLHEFAASAKELPNAIVVEGHTDDRPIRGGRYPTNWELSMARAASVVRYLSAEEGIAASRLSGSGFAEFKPAQPNATPEGRSANRRIEISLLRRE
ncbi:MAG: OmpA family protein [Elusimicrobia bacterium]|nr:OmpA family protein [Elusimicrobiota bacterium]